MEPPITIVKILAGIRTVNGILAAAVTMPQEQCRIAILQNKA